MADWPNERKKQFWAGVAERLKEIRRLFGMSEEEAAAAMQITLRTYRKWERGERHAENHFGVLDFCLLHQIELEWLFGGPECGKPPRFKLRLVVG